MTKDLEDTLAELGPEYRAVVARLRTGIEAETATGTTAPAFLAGCRSRRVAMLSAATLLVAIGIAAIMGRGTGETPSGGMQPPTVIGRVPLENEYRLAHDGGDAAARELVRTQNADGSWKTLFLTKQNAKALRKRSEPEARLAYRKAVRNLRLSGVPLDS